MSRMEAVIEIARIPRALIQVSYAREISEALGVRLDALLYIAPNLVRSMHGPTAVYLRGAPSDLVQMSDLGAAVCRYMGLYADGDHATQSPHGTAGKQANYIGKRAAVRLARQWWGEAGVRELVQDVPEIQTAGVGIFRRDPVTGQKTGEIVGKDALLAEKPYKP